MSAGDLPCLLTVVLAEPVGKQVNAVRRNGLPLIAIEVIHRLQLAGRGNQSGDNDIAKKPLRLRQSQRGLEQFERADAFDRDAGG
ncbi:MAG: hypothetical protein MUC65_03055 [Pontiellaceae bacterium]|jgi:hypothetical protein|nr:hypothetical protein [Pontiellaceae bacterium]